MKRNRKTANVFSTLIVLAAVGSSWIVYTYLPVSPERWTLAMACPMIGVTAAWAFHAVVTRLPDKRWVRLAIISSFALLAMDPLLSVAFQRITYSRFGFTVYGAMPVPLLDLTINQHGILWFRPKTHQITRDELDAIAVPGVEIVIVGNGWDSIAQLTDEAKLLSAKIDLRVMPTPAAFALYNKLKAQGRKVVLLAHSTC